ncbi:MAG: GNAT family N-acetyltransferase [Lewinella sp.]
MSLTLEFRPFRKEDFIEYKSWYAEKQLDRWLGPMDAKWLEYVMNDTDGREFAILREDMLIAVVGIDLPQRGEEYSAITDMAVRPELRNQGLGGRVLSRLLQEVPLSKGEYWACYVEPDNAGARRFFTRQGWQAFSEEEGMVRFEYRPAIG